MYFFFTVQVHYNSKTVSGDSPITSSNGSNVKYCPDMDPGGYDSLSYRSSFLAVDSNQMSCSTLRKLGTKKACLFAWVTLQSIPEVLLCIFYAIIFAVVLFCLRYFLN